MFGSDTLDVGIGMIFLFLFASLVTTALREAIEVWMKSRAMDLERGIREMFKEQDGKNYVQKFFDHPSIFGLYTGKYDPTKLADAKRLLGGADTKIMPRKARTSLPTYIPSQSFSAALLDIVRQHAGDDAPMSAASLREGIKKMKSETDQDNGPIRYALLTALDEAKDDVTAARKSIEAWYDASMDRVSGWYKRRTQAALLAIGFATAALFNIDAITVGRHLANEREYREAIVASVPAIRQVLEAKLAASKPTENAAEAKGKGGTEESAPGAGASQGQATGQQAAGTAAEDARKPATSAKSVVPSTGEAGGIGAVDEVKKVLKAFEGTGFALGWPAPQFDVCREKEGTCGFWAYFAKFATMLAGWIVTALAVSLGAPFWFDLLNKFMVVRSTVKPSEKSGQEGSKDSASTKTDGTAAASLTLHIQQQQPTNGTAPPQPA